MPLLRLCCQHVQVKKVQPPPQSTTVNNTAAGETTTTGETTTAEETTTVAAEKKYTVGEAAEKDDVKITLTNVSETSGSEYNTAPDGKVFILAEFLIENNSNEEISISSMLNFEAYIDDFSSSTSLSAMIEGEQLDGSIAAGKKLKGILGFEAETDWKELSIVYKPNFLSSDSIEFIYSK